MNRVVCPVPGRILAIRARPEAELSLVCAREAREMKPRAEWSRLRHHRSRDRRRAGVRDHVCVVEALSEAVDAERPRRATAVVKPQALMLGLLAWYLYERRVGVFSGSAIDVLSRCGVGEHATRSTLARMVDRGLLERHRRGRRVYFALTAHATRELREGRRRIDEPVDHDWDGWWTLVAFSMPQSWGARRHLLRSRLLWARFGLLQSGLWIAPSQVDVVALLEGLDVGDHVTVFHARPDEPTDIGALVSEAWNLDAIASEYRGFLERWHGRPRPSTQDPLAQHLLVQAEWLRLLRLDPRLPLRHLPKDWPAVKAEKLFRRLTDELAGPAAVEAEAALDLLPIRARRA